MSVGGVAGEERAEAVEIAVDLLRREEAELEVDSFVTQQQSRERRGCAGHSLRRLEDVLAPRHILAQAPRDLEVMLRLVPRALYLVVIGPRGFLDDDGVGRQQLQQRPPGRRRRLPVA